MTGRMGDSKHMHSSVIPGKVYGFRRRITETEGLKSSSRLIFWKGRVAGGIAVSKLTTHLRYRVERFISEKRLLV